MDSNSFFRNMNLIFLVALLIVFVSFIIEVQNSDMNIGKKISKQSYIKENGEIDKASWLWNLSEFVAIMAGFAYFFDKFYEGAFKKARKDKQNRRKEANSTKENANSV